MKLYEIANAYRATLECLPDDDEQAQLVLADLHGALTDKAAAIAAVVLEMEAEAHALREAEKRMADRRRAVEARAHRLREYLREQMEACGIEEIRSADSVLRVRLRTCPPSVALDDSLPELPAEYWRERVIREPDKARILEDLREGVIVPGARLVRRRRVEIA